VKQYPTGRTSFSWGTALVYYKLFEVLIAAASYYQRLSVDRDINCSKSKVGVYQRRGVINIG
jgi:hypothetical protein